MKTYIPNSGSNNPENIQDSGSCSHERVPTPWTLSRNKSTGKNKPSFFGGVDVFLLPEDRKGPFALGKLKTLA